MATIIERCAVQFALSLALLTADLACAQEQRAPEKLVVDDRGCGRRVGAEKQVLAEFSGAVLAPPSLTSLLRSEGLLESVSIEFGGLDNPPRTKHGYQVLVVPVASAMGRGGETGKLLHAEFGHPREYQIEAERRLIATTFRNIPPPSLSEALDRSHIEDLNYLAFTDLTRRYYGTPPALVFYLANKPAFVLCPVGGSEVSHIIAGQVSLCRDAWMGLFSSPITVSGPNEPIVELHTLSLAEREYCKYVSDGS